MTNPNVFISYSHDSEEHEAWAAKLASDLRSHGVNAIFDQWDLRIGKDLRFFMENGLSASNLVVCICSEAYVRKTDGGVGGAGYEGMLMTQELLSNANAEHIIPIVRNNNSSQKVPRALGSKLYIDFSDDSQYVKKYTELLERIYGEDVKKKPPLGKNPFSGDVAQQIRIKTQIESVRFHSSAMEGTVTFQFDDNNGIYSIGNGEYAFNTRWSGAGNNSIYAYGFIGYKHGETEFPSVDNLHDFDYSSSTRFIHTGEIVIVKNEYEHFAAIKLGPVKSSSHGYPLDEMVFSYHIYDMI